MKKSNYFFFVKIKYYLYNRNLQQVTGHILWMVTDAKEVDGTITKKLSNNAKRRIQKGAVCRTT